jgi:hypothetical protein
MKLSNWILIQNRFKPIKHKDMENIWSPPLKLAVVFASRIDGLHIGYGCVLSTLELSTTWNLVLHFYQVRLGHEKLSVIHHSVLPDFARDCVVLYID